jgi:hypothetical protein
MIKKTLGLVGLLFVSTSLAKGDTNQEFNNLIYEKVDCSEVFPVITNIVCYKVIKSNVLHYQLGTTYKF